MASQKTHSEQINKHRLIELLRSIDRPGDYCAGGTLQVPMPQISLKNVEPLSFPVPKTQIDALIEIAERAPYGKGTKTLTDTSVRDCWQIDARKIRITGKAWANSFKKIMNLVSDGLGLQQAQLDAKLYKLLVYTEGGFFAAHRDTEKVRGMVATLSLSLPTSGEGGELSIRHAGKETVFNMNAQEPSELSYAAFYADCLHEVQPVTKGHRISLVYNLFIRSGKKWTGAPDYTDLTDKVRECLVDWIDSGETEKIVWMLDHSYSEGGLSFNTLKGTDAAVAQVLGEAADRTGCDMHAAVLYIQETGEPDLDYDPDDWGKVIITSTFAHFIERDEYLENWIARDGSRPPFGELSIQEEELLPTASIDGLEPDEELLEEYMGNYGPTLDLIYRVAALVVWPRTNTIKIVSSAEFGNAVSWVATQSNQISDAAMRRLLVQLAELWPEDQDRHNDDHRSTVLGLLSTAGNVGMATDFLDRVIQVRYNGSENEHLADLMPLIGPDTAKEFLLHLIEQHMLTHPTGILSLLAMITEKLAQHELVWYNIIRETVQSIMSQLPTVLKKITETVSRMPQNDGHGKNECIIWGPDCENPLDSTAIHNLFALTWHLDLPQEFLEAATTIADFPKAATPDRILPEALADLYKIEQIRSTETYKLLWRQSVDFLLQRSSSAPAEKPSDWIIAVDVPCTCEPCTELQAFCLNPSRRTKTFRIEDAARQRIQEAIDGLGLDISYVTVRKGHPHALRCTKTLKGHKRRLVQYSEDINYIERLLTLVPKDEAKNAEADRIKRLEAAKAAFPDNR